MSNDANHSPSSTTTAGERQSIDTPEFRELLDDCYEVIEGGQMSEALEYFEGKLIAHIDTWAGRSAGDAVPAAEVIEEIIPGTCIMARDVKFLDGRAKPGDKLYLAAAPAPGNTEHGTGDAA